jgi:prophage DNA circulation protein
MVEDKVAICFDEENKIRVLDPKAFKHSEELERECKAFVSKMQDFSQSVSAVVEVLDCHAKHIEREKLRAIGMRNMVGALLAVSARCSLSRRPAYSLQPFLFSGGRRAREES